VQILGLRVAPVNSAAEPLLLQPMLNAPLRPLIP
jgi:hypothetical protein